MRVTVAVVGKARDRALATAIAEYEARAARYWPLDVREVREHPARRGDDEAGVALVRSKEGERLLDARTTGAFCVACHVGGRSFTSTAFAAWLNEQRDRARDVVFFVGGAFGLSDDVRAQSQLALSLAPWTLPHEIARLVLAEQLYRAGTIVRGEPYNK